jgi:hypothetical protein
MRENRPVVAVALAVLLLLAGCMGSGGQDMAATEAAVDAGGGDAASQEAKSTPADDSSKAAVAQNRKRIRTAELRLTVAAFETSRSNLSAAVAANGGYVSNVQVRTEEQYNETYTDGRIVYRVPSENYSDFVETVSAEGEVVSEESDVNDVTQRHADLEARLESLRAERDRLRELYEEANETEDVLQVQRELSEVQREIETTEAKLRTLESQIAYSTVTVRLREERPDREPEVEHWYDTGVIAAFLDSIDGVIVTLRALVVGIAYVLPYLLVFGLPAYGIVLLGRRVRGGDELPLVGGSGGNGDGDTGGGSDAGTSGESERTGLDVNEREE